MVDSNTPQIPLQNIKYIKMRTTEQQQQYLATYNNQPKLQLKISEIFTYPPSQFVFQSDNIMVVHRDGSTVEVFVCNNGFTGLQYVFCIEGVLCLRDVRIRYNAEDRYIVFVYRVKNDVCFYAGQVPVQSESRSVYRSSIKGESLYRAQFNTSENILSISDIILIPIFGHHCLITVTSGKTYFVHYYKHTLSVRQTASSSKIYNIFKTIMKPITSTPNYTNCQTFLYPSQDSGLYYLNLLDTVLQMKYFNIANENNWHELNSWEIDLNRELGESLVILNSLFVYQDRIEGWHGVSLVILCLVEDKVDMFIIGIDFNTKIKRIQTLKDILNIQQESDDPNGPTQQPQQNQANQNQQSEMVEEQSPQIAFIKDIDYFELQYNNGKIYIIFHQKLPGDNIYNNRICLFMLVKKIQDQLTMMTQPKIINVNGDMRLVKNQEAISQTHMENQVLRRRDKTVQVLLVSETSCFCFQFRSLTNYVQMQEGLENIFIPLPGRGRRLPPIPQYDDQQPRKNQQKLQQIKPQQKNNKRREIQNQYSYRNLQRYTYTRNYFQLFCSLEHQKQKLYDELQQTKITEIMAGNPKRISEQLQNCILLKLFTIQSGSHYAFDHDLVDFVFEENLFGRYFEKSSDLLFTFLRNIFIKEDTEYKIQQNQQFKSLDKRSNSLHELNLILKVLIDSRNYTVLYNVCVETIPNFIQNILGRFKKELNEEMSDEEGPAEIFQNLKAEFAISYLNLYQILISKLNISYMATQSVPPHNTRKKSSNNYSMNQSPQKPKRQHIQFGQYYHKELLSKYLKMIELTSTRKSLIQHKAQRKQNPHLYVEAQNIPTLVQIVDMYLNKKDEKYAGFFISMATQYKNVTVFDHMLRKRLVSKEGLTKFIDQNWNSLQKNQLLRILINLVQTQIRKIAENSRPSSECLKILTWIPASSAQNIFEYLMRIYPKIGILYGLTFKKRRDLANQIAAKQQIFDVFNTEPAQIVLELLQPFYTCNIENISIKLNADLARLFAQANQSFKSVNQLLKQNGSGVKIKVQGDHLQSFYQKISKYLSPEKVQIIKERIKK